VVQVKHTVNKKLGVAPPPVQSEASPKRARLITVVLVVFVTVCVAVLWRLMSQT
jgi:hypothetical protein